jgi:hypothetical protein
MHPGAELNFQILLNNVQHFIAQPGFSHIEITFLTSPSDNKKKKSFDELPFASGKILGHSCNLYIPVSCAEFELLTFLVNANLVQS